MKTRPPLTRHGSDDFQTPPEALNPLLPFLRPEWTIWECACGKGYLAGAMCQAGFPVIATDKEKDFLAWQPERFDCIVTNPPYSLKNEFLERAYTLGKPFAFLLPLTALESQRRQRLFRAHGIDLLLLDERIHFENPANVRPHPWFTVAWFCWRLGLRKQLTFTKVTHKAERNIPMPKKRQEVTTTCVSSNQVGRPGESYKASVENIKTALEAIATRIKAIRRTRQEQVEFALTVGEGLEALFHSGAWKTEGGYSSWQFFLKHELNISDQTGLNYRYLFTNKDRLLELQAKYPEASYLRLLTLLRKAGEEEKALGPDTSVTSNKSPQPTTRNPDEGTKAQEDDADVDQDGDPEDREQAILDEAEDDEVRQLRKELRQVTPLDRAQAILSALQMLVDDLIDNLGDQDLSATLEEVCEYADAARVVWENGRPAD